MLEGLYFSRLYFGFFQCLDVHGSCGKNLSAKQGAPLRHPTVFHYEGTMVQDAQVTDLLINTTKRTRKRKVKRELYGNSIKI